MNHRTPLSVSISELKKNPSAIINQAQGQAVTILSHNKPTAYLISVAEYEALIGQSNLGTRLANRLKGLGGDDFVIAERTDTPRGF